jgi:5'-nucleotidase
VPRILVTNDDGIGSRGLHRLARAATALGDVVVVAPDAEYSGASAALGPLHLIQPDVHEARIDGIEEAWAVSGPPALCVYYARLGAFGGEAFDLVLAGINPGANVGRSVQHSGTVGAALTAVTGGLPAVAVSQSVPGPAVEGQAVGEVLDSQHWETAATVGVTVGRALLGGGAVAVNVNVPNRPLAEVEGWAATDLAPAPSRSIGEVTLIPKEGFPGTYAVKTSWGRSQGLPPESDGGTVRRGLVSVSVLFPISALDPSLPVPAASELDDLLRAG